MKSVSKILRICLSLLFFTTITPVNAQDDGTVAEAQGDPQTVVILQSAILTINPDRLFSESLYGLRVLEQIRADSIALAAENREIEGQLTAEELSLTERRPTMTLEAFRPLAEAFDNKAQQIRVEQTAKATEIRARPEKARQEFLRMAQDVLVEIMRERRALAIFPNDAVFLVADTIDITNEAIERINALIGDGSQ